MFGFVSKNIKIQVILSSKQKLIQTLSSRLLCSRRLHMPCNFFKKIYCVTSYVAGDSIALVIILINTYCAVSFVVGDSKAHHRCRLFENTATHTMDFHYVKMTYLVAHYLRGDAKRYAICLLIGDSISWTILCRQLRSRL